MGRAGQTRGKRKVRRVPEDERIRTTGERGGNGQTSPVEPIESARAGVSYRETGKRLAVVIVRRCVVTIAARFAIAAQPVAMPTTG